MAMADSCHPSPHMGAKMGRSSRNCTVRSANVSASPMQSAHQVSLIWLSIELLYHQKRDQGDRRARPLLAAASEEQVENDKDDDEGDYAAANVHDRPSFVRKTISLGRTHAFTLTGASRHAQCRMYRDSQAI